MELAIDNLTTTEAAVVAGVSVDDVNRTIDRKILPENLYWTATVRTLKRDACIWIAFWFETSEWLTPEARKRMILEGSRLCSTWAELRTCKLQESRTIKVGIEDIWNDVNARFKELQTAQQMVIEDPEVLSGTPVIQGTRIPVYDVASLVDERTPMDELKELYPRLSEEQFHLAFVYAEARPLRGRPKRKSLPDSSKISVSKTHLREASI